MAWLATTADTFSRTLNRFAQRLTANRQETAVLPAYDNIVAQARSPAFYEQLSVPDTPQGRFELVLLHAILLMRHTCQPAFNQQLFDLMFADFDIGLRELGVGDLGVGKRVHSWAAAFRGRAAVYAAALSNSDEDGTAAMAAAVTRNVYAQSPAADGGQRLAVYVIAAAAELAEQDCNSLIEGTTRWPKPEAIA